MKRRELLMTTFGTLGWFAMKQIGAAGPVSLYERQKEVEPILQELEAMRGKFSNVPRTDGQLLNMLVKIARARNVLEVGTSNGYSAIWFCLALEETDGHLTTIEINPEKVKMAKENLKRAGLSHRVTIIEGDGHKVVPLLDDKFDFVFLDADKGREQDYFGYLFPQKLVAGAVIAVHNAIRMKGAMKRYLEMITSHPEFDTVFVSTTLDDGFVISYWRRK